MNEKVNNFINSYSDWRGAKLSELRKIINDNSPEFTEELKWGVPVWTYNGLVCAISGFKDHVKINFFKGAYLPDHSGVFNSGLDSKEHRSINIASGDEINSEAIIKLVNLAKEYNSKDK